jgi:hypothetical protein
MVGGVGMGKGRPSKCLRGLALGLWMCWAGEFLFRET